MRTKSLLGVLLIGALCVSAAGAAQPDFPRILIHNFNVRPPMPAAQIEALARRDLIVLAPIFRKDYADLAAIRKLNPQITILQYALTYQIGFDDRAPLSNDEEAELFRAHPESWLTTATLALLAKPISASETTITLSADLPAPAKKDVPPVLLCGAELMRVTGGGGNTREVLRGRCGTAAQPHAAGTAVVKVMQPPSWVAWYRTVTDQSEVLDLNISDRAPRIDGRQPWQVKADYLAEKCWADPVWRKAFDGFFLDEGQAQVAPQRIDLDRDGQSDQPGEVYAAMQRGLRLMCRRLRERCGDELILVLNNNPDIVPGVSGRHREHFADVEIGQKSGRDAGWLGPFGTWAYSVEPLRAWQDLGHRPVVSINSSQPGTWDNYRQMRFGLASALLYDGYYQYRSQSGDTGNWKHWFDEYSVDPQGRATDGATGRHWLGKPLGPARQWLAPLSSFNALAGAKWKVHAGSASDADARLQQQDGSVQVSIRSLKVPKPESVLLGARGAGSLQPGAEYTLTLETRASSPRLVDVRVVDAQGSLGRSQVQIPMYVQTQWQRHVFTCCYRDREPLEQFELSFALGRDEGEVELRNVVWQQGTAEIGWTREFQHGMVVVNPTRAARVFENVGRFRAILGRQDPAHNDSRAIGARLEVAPLDAFLLQRIP